MANAPFCNVTVATPPGDPGDAAHRAAQAGGNIQMIPAHANLGQLIRILNQNFQNIINNYGTRPPTPAEPDPFNQGFKTKPGNEDWKEVTRRTETVRIPVQDDSGAQVGVAEVKQITGLTMRSKKTGETWVWKR